MTTTIERDALATTYEDSLEVIRRTVAIFHSRFSGDFEELMCEANILFMLSYDSWEEAKGNFENWLTYRIRRGLMDTLRKAQYRKACAKMEPLIQDPMDQMDFLPFDQEAMEVSADAKLVCRLLFDTPRDLAEAIFATDVEDALDKSTGRTRFVLGQGLAKIGWTVDRISETFTEISEVL